MRVLVLGASGMLGFALHRVFHDRGIEVVGAVRGAARPQSSRCADLQYLCGVDVLDLSTVIAAVEALRVDVVVNSVGLTGSELDTDVLKLFAVNARFPRLLA